MDSIVNFLVSIVAPNNSNPMGNVPLSTNEVSMQPVWRLVSLALLLLMLGSPPTFAQWAVFDGANFGQNVLNLAQNTMTALRSFTSNINEVTQIQNQLTSLANDAKQLTVLPLSLVTEINTAIGEYTSLLNQGQGMAFTVQASVDQFEALYKTATSSDGNFLQRAQRLADQVRQAGQVATMASSVFTRLCAQQNRVGQLLAASQGAVGSLQAEQASNQLLGVMAEQQISVQELLATNHRLQLSEAMRQLVLEERAQANAQAWVQGLETVPLRGPGEGKGFTLPE
jgi:P-type conjugative transfer protein TrbJ